jgi:hypothetical protein
MAISLSQCSGPASLAIAILFALAVCLSPVAVAANDRSPATSSPAATSPAVSEPIGRDGMLNVEHRQTMFSMTGQQTMVVAAAIGGAALVAATGGLQPAILVGTAVLSIYLMMP